jgi:hypothetical protein
MNWLTNIFQGLGNLAGGAGKSIGSLFGGGGGSGASNMMSALGGTNQFMGGGGNKSQSYSPMTSMAQGGQGGGFLNSIFKNPAAGVGGLGVMGLGQLMNKPTKMPDFGSNPAVQQLQGWSSQANHPMDPNVQAAMQHTLDIQNEQQLRNLRDVYKNLRPGTDYTTDSAYQRDLANLNRSIAQNNADAMAGQQFNSNQQQLGNLTNMAQLQVGQQMGQAGIDAQRQQQQNEMFGNIGSMLLQQGIGQPDFMKLFLGR